MRAICGLALLVVAAGCDPVETTEDLERGINDALGICHWESTGAPVADADLAELEEDECLVLRTGDGSRLSFVGDDLDCGNVEDDGITCVVLRASGPATKIWWDDFGTADQLKAFVRHGDECTCG